MATAAGRRLSNRTSSSSANQLLRSFYEGWAYHFTPESRKWIRRWLVVDGSRLVVFASDRNCSQAVVVSLNLGQGTKVKDIALRPNVYGLDIELTTLKGLTESRTDFFGFSTPNECDLWKAYILGFSYGVVPENLNLLPGQLKDVRESIMDNGLAPPPLPSPHHKRPLLQNVLPQPTMMTMKMMTQQQQRPTQNVIFSSTHDDGLSSRHSPSAVISPYSEISTTSQPRGQFLDSADVGGIFAEGDETDVLEQLEQRRNKLAMIALEKEMERMPSNQEHQRGFPPKTVRSLVQMRQQQPPSSWNQSQQSVVMSNKDSIRLASQRVSLPKLRTPLAVMNNNELPPFYDDPEKNKVTPSWFLSCDRETAEMVLTGARSCGNVFMRPSFNINPSETYVISMRRDLPGGLELRHYAVHRTTDGFKLDVVDKHSPMSCLSDVMSFFATYVGPSAQLLNSQDVQRLFGNVLLSPASITSPRPESSSLSSSSQEQLIAKRTADSSLENEGKPGEDNERSEKEESHQVLNSSLTSADEHLDESIIQPLQINAKNNAAISTTQENEAASDHLLSETQHLNDLVSEEKVDASTCC